MASQVLSIVILLVALIGYIALIQRALRADKRVTVTRIFQILGLFVAGMWVLLVGSIHFFPMVMIALVDKTPPVPITAEELRTIESRFSDARPALERIVAATQGSQWKSLRAARDTAARNHDWNRRWAIERGFDQFFEPMLRSTRPRLVAVVLRSDSLIYVRALTRRGKGPSAGWVHAGYVYSSQWPLRAKKQLDEKWYLFSEEEPG